MPKTNAEIEVFVSPAEFRSVLADVASYPEFLNEVSSVTVSKQTETALVACFKVSVSFGGYDVETRYTLAYDLSDPMCVRWSLVDSPDLTVNQGSWTLGPGEDEDECIATYESEIVSTLPIPIVVQEMFAKETLPDLLDAFRERAER